VCDRERAVVQVNKIEATEKKKKKKKKKRSRGQWQQQQQQLRPLSLFKRITDEYDSQCAVKKKLRVGYYVIILTTPTPSVTRQPSQHQRLQLM
jgi:hypothetical protein